MNTLTRPANRTLLASLAKGITASAAAAIGFSGCLSSNGGSFYIAKSQGPSWNYSGETFSQDVGFGFFRLTNGAVYSFAQDTLSVSAYSDSNCTTPAGGSFTVAKTSASTSSGQATFGGVSYTWPQSNREGNFYIKASASGYGVSTCGGPFLITQHFGGGSCFTTDCSGPGIQAATGASLNELAYRVFFSDDGLLYAVGQVTINGYGAGQRAQAIWRFNPNGTKDTTYATSGAYTNAALTSVAGGTAGNFSDKFWGATEDSSNRMVIVGESWTAGGAVRMAAFRFTSAGTQDTTFSGGNYYYVHPTNVGGGTFDEARAVIVDSQNRIVITGWSTNASGGTQSAIWRLTSAGAIDTSFNGSGSHTYGVPTVAGHATASSVTEGIMAIAEDSQGRYIGAGHSKNSAGGLNLALWRYKSDGTLDSTFGSGGATYYNGSFAGAAAASQQDNARSIRVDSSGKYVVSGTSKNSAGGFQLLVARFNTDGSLDTTFATNGYFLQGMPNLLANSSAALQSGWSHGLVIHPTTGAIYVSGYDQDSTGYKRGLIYKFNSSGQLDTSFGSGGYAITQSQKPYKPGQLTGHFVYGIDIDPVGRLVLAGQAWNGTGFDVAVWRFLPDGTLDQ